MATAAAGSLDVVALVSGGKDSFFSILHCLAQGHRVVALANLYPPLPPPPPPSSSPSTRLAPAPTQHGAPAGSVPDPTTALATASGSSSHPPESDLNSFMYQTVGHQTIPLYAQATGLPLYRQPIHGSAVHHGISYTPGGHYRHQGSHEDHDETESLVPLLRAVMKAHPQVNAVSTGAILSTYQRTRVESVALRLGLVPLGYLWQYPDLPRPIGATVSNDVEDDAQLLRDMAGAGLEARIIKVASAGLDEGFLWENVASERGISRIQRGLRKFGGGGKGAVLGEGGEFETLVVDGPPELFKGRIIVHEDDRQVVREGGGSEWLLIRAAAVQMKADSSAGCDVPLVNRSLPIPALLDTKFEAVLERAGQRLKPHVRTAGPAHDSNVREAPAIRLPLKSYIVRKYGNERVSFVGQFGAPRGGGNSDDSMSAVQRQTEQLVQDITSYLSSRSLEPSHHILNSIIVLRHMGDFPAVNKLYGSLFAGAVNPPSRVTISCGDLLPAGCQIAVYLTIITQSTADQRDIQHRKGLHVQSRSYWAPANIGPYSQAISYPLIRSISGYANSTMSDEDDEDGTAATGGDDTGGLLAVSIAGQIPLIPATMEFPLPGNDKTALDTTQITLALQHLWRVGAVTEVAWWTSVVAYFPSASAPRAGVTGSSEGGRSRRDILMRENSIAAAQAWKEAHIWSPPKKKSVDSDEGPDLWDRRYNSQYQSYAADDNAAATAGGKPAQLPRWNVIAGLSGEDDDEDELDEDNDNDENEGGASTWDERMATREQARRERRAKHVPFVFSAEVEELPRSAGVEWHAHVGLGRIPEGSVQVAAVRDSGDVGTGDRSSSVVDLHHVTVSTPQPRGSTYLHTAAVLYRPGDGGDDDDDDDANNNNNKGLDDVLRRLSDAVAKSVAGLLPSSSSNDKGSIVAVTSPVTAASESAMPVIAAPYLVYTDSSQIGPHTPRATAADPTTPLSSSVPALIPCHSLWDEQGRRLAAVALFETLLYPGAAAPSA
ncbi:diphthine-ammonia ligase [Microdochium nivale]|nr:diphthine-ammonia ligase [Microdochium nivale]